MADDDVELAAVAGRIRSARRLAGLTQQEAAERIGATARTWARWETGESQGCLGQLPRIAEVLGASEEQLRGGPPRGVEALLSEILERLVRVESVVDQLLATGRS